MKRQNINKFVATILGVILCFLFVGCDGNETYFITVTYVNETSQGVTATITHDYNQKILIIPANESRKFKQQFYVAGDGFFVSLNSVVLNFDDSKQVIYNKPADDKDKKTHLCYSRNYTKIKDGEYSASITADHYNEAK